MQISINRSIEVTPFPIIKGNIPFSIFSKSEKSNACGSEPEAYVIDTYKDWKYIADKINSGTRINEPNLDNISLLVYLFGQLRTSGNKFAINNVEGIPATQSILVNIDFADGPFDALSCPYLIVSIPRTGYKTVLFEVRNMPLDSLHLIDFGTSNDL